MNALGNRNRAKKHIEEQVINFLKKAMVEFFINLLFFLNFEFYEHLFYLLFRTILFEENLLLFQIYLKFNI